MTKKNLKDIVDQIHKLASPPPGKRPGYVSSGKPQSGSGTAPGTKTVPGHGGAPAPGKRTLPGHGGHSTGPVPGKGRTGGEGGGYDRNAIIKMQQSMVDLAKAVISQIKVIDLAQSMSQGGKPSQEAIEAGGRNSFGDLMAQMMRDSDIKGVEYDPSAKAKQMSQKKPSDPTRMNVVMNTMQRIGGPEAETSVDGEWGPRTNAALHNVHAFAYSLLQLAGGLEIPIQSYSQGDLQGFKLPEKDTDYSPAKKSQQAPILTEHVDAIKRMYDEVKKNILENPQYQTYIENDTPYATFGKSKTQSGKPGKPGSPPAQQPAMITAEDAQEVAKIFPNLSVAFTGADGQVQKKPISITNLVTLQALQAWMKNSGVNLNISEITRQIRQQVSLMPREYTPEQDQAWSNKKWQEEKDKGKAISSGKPGVNVQVGGKTAQNRWSK